MKEVYFVTIKREGDLEPHAEERRGYIFTDRRRNTYGCVFDKVRRVWDITELKTGCKANIIGREPRKRSEIPAFIDSIADFVYEHVVKDDNSYPKLKATIKEAYAKWEREHIGRELD